MNIEALLTYSSESHITLVFSSILTINNIQLIGGRVVIIAE